MMLSYLIHKALNKVYRKLIDSVIVVSVFREVSFNHIIINKTFFVTYDLNFSVFDSTERVGYNRKSGYTRSEESFYIPVV